MLLDTHIVLWFVDGDDRLNKSIREDIEYFNGSFDISVLSVMEIVNLVQLGKYKLGISLKQFLNKLDVYKIKLVAVSKSDLIELEKLPVLNFNGKAHSDMMDRMIIAQAISHKTTLISADRKFPAYRRYGLDLLEQSN